MLLEHWKMNRLSETRPLQNEITSQSTQSSSNMANHNFGHESVSCESLSELYSILNKEQNLKTKGFSEQLGEFSCCGLDNAQFYSYIAVNMDVLSNMCGEEKSGAISDYKICRSSDSVVEEPSREIEIQVPEEELETVRNLFSKPRKVLQTFYSMVAQKLRNPKYKIDQKFIQNYSSEVKWKCVYNIKWPNKVCFSGEASHKSVAANEAALKVLHWLRSSERITDNGGLSVYKNEKGEKMPVRVSMDVESIPDVELVLNWYHKEISALIDGSETDTDSVISDNNDQDSRHNDDNPHPISGHTHHERTAEDLSQRNRSLYNALSRRRRSNSFGRDEENMLPITPLRSQVCQLVSENQIIIIKGETGCGKSTQVPQFIMDQWISESRGALCNIVVTQPRRISAISLAKRVVQERREMMGDVVGYQVRFEFVPPSPLGGAILFCSTGILLLRLKTNPGLFGLSHVILDEAHERDVNTDFLLVLLKRALKLNPDLKVIVMSATINAEQFQNYFDGAACLHVPGFTFPVKSYFLDDMDIPGLRLKSSSSCLATPRIFYEDVIRIIMWIDENRAPGAILCFLPGWAEIKGVLRLLEEKMDPDTSYIVPVHSRLPYQEQHLIFSTPDEGIRKVILATNIAENSITVNDVRYVVDTGSHKEKRLNTVTGLSFLDNHWISKASVKQRKGRAGRVQEGESYHLYTIERYEAMDPYPMPEVLRVPLEKIILDCKFFSEKDKVKKFLSEMLDSPSQEAVSQAMEYLIQLGAIDTDENLTDLGKRIASFTTHPQISKALIHSVIFRCVSPVLTVSTVLANSTEIFNCTLHEREITRKNKRVFHPTSDHIAIAWLYQQWEQYMKSKKVDGDKFSDEMCLRKENMEVTRKLRRIYAEHLYQEKMLEDIDMYDNLLHDTNAYSGNDELVKGVLFSGWNNVLTERKWGMRRGQFTDNESVMITQSGHRTFISPDSVNFMNGSFKSPFLTYFYLTTSLEKRAMVTWDTSVISPLTLCLFKDGIISIRKASADDTASDVILNLGDSLEVTCDKCEAPLLLDLRSVLHRVLKYFVSNEGHVYNDRHRIIMSFRDKLLELLAKLLHKASYATDLKKEDDEDCDDGRDVQL